LYWIAISFKTAGIGGYYLGFFAVFLLSFFLSIFSALSFYLIKKFILKKYLILNVISIIFILSIFDWLKGNILWGFPWTPISAIWTFHEITLAPFANIGVWGYSLITYSLVAAIYIFNKNIKIAFFTLLPFFFIITISNLSNKNTNSKIDDLNIRLVQPNIRQNDKWNQNKAFNNLRHLIDLSLFGNVKDKELIIWPETAVTFDMLKSSKYKEYLDSKTENVNNLILGAIRREKISTDNKIYNSLFLKNNSNEINHYDKIKLVPFGEFIPFRKFLDKNNVPLVGLDFSSGNALNILNLKENVNILPLICYEVIFPEITKKVSRKYNLIVNITNDAWFGKSRGPYQHLSLAKIRAVLEGKYLIRVANTGITAIIDYNGKIIDKIDINKIGIIDKKLVLSKKNTLYSYYGNNIFYISLLILFLVFSFANFKIRLKNKNG